MADRVFVYDGALPQTTDILNTNKFSMIGNSFLAQAALGSGGAVAGLACSPTSPASLVVSIGMGSIYQLDECDATAYGDLGTDTTVFVKQGLLYAPKTLTVVPPSTSGYSQIFLVEAILDDIDAGTELISYYNSGNVNQPFAGPAGDGQSQFTTRTVTCAVALKAGVAAPTGSETTPTPDTGYVGLWTITVANGQTQITSANIAQYANAPFFPTLPAVPLDVQNSTWVGFNDTGSANNYSIAPAPPPASVTPYQKWRIKIADANTTASVLNVLLANGTTFTAPMAYPGGSPLGGGELVQGGISEFVYDGANFELLSSVPIGRANITNFNRLAGTSAGAVKTASWTIEQIVAVTALGKVAYTGTNLSLSFNGANLGVNGMDLSTMPTSADLSVYAIYNPTTGVWGTLGCLGTTSNGSAYTGANMPAGYVASCLIWAGCTGGLANFYHFVQKNRLITIPAQIVVNALNATSYTSVSLTGIVPACAITVAGYLYIICSIANTLWVASSSGGAGVEACGTSDAAAGVWGSFNDLPMLTSQTIYYYIASASGSAAATVAVTRYTI